MKVGVLQFFSWPERRFPLGEVYERALQRIDVMDEGGYDAVWLAEHHFNTFSVCPSVHMMGTMVAARTKRLRIGMGVSLAAFYHPLRLAEEVALLDHFSGGRVNWGAGRGFDAKEFKAFGIDRDESYPRFREHFEIVLEAWKQERLTYKGQFWDFDGVEVLPKPLQEPHPPVWVAASTPGAVEWAANKGHTIMMDPHSAHADIGTKRRLYQQTLEAAGHSIAGRDIPMARLMAIGETQAEAEEIARSGASWTVGSYMRPKSALGKGEAHAHNESMFVDKAQQKAAEEDPVQRYMDNVVVYGTPSQVVDTLKAMEQELPMNYLLVSPLSHGTFELFTQKVLPQLV
jgi:alkanesulfonate monooxygenase SsuD/methylene tetrahydromethanopterin reductase-like flavin-dependent oxidoreductase (luciferase family)